MQMEVPGTTIEQQLDLKSKTRKNIGCWVLLKYCHLYHLPSDCYLRSKQIHTTEAKIKITSTSSLVLEKYAERWLWYSPPSRLLDVGWHRESNKLPDLVELLQRSKLQGVVPTKLVLAMATARAGMCW
jgi:hypothetical protein